MNPELADDLIRRALAEDAPWGDLTSDAFLPRDTRATAVLVSRESGILSGIDVFARVFEIVDADPRRIKRVRLRQPRAAGSGAGDETPA